MKTKISSFIKLALSFSLAIAFLSLWQMPIFAQAAEADPITFPELAGKKVSILGDSLTSYRGTASNGTQSTSHTNKFEYYIGTYPNDRSGITSIEQMFYGRFFAENNMELYINNSIGGTGVTINYTPVLDQSITFLGGTESQNRILGLWDYDENGNRVDPDIILVSGSGNDFDLAPLGDWDGNIAALDASSHPATFKEAYAVLLKRLQAEYPNADIWCITLQSYSDILSNPVTQFPDTNQFGDTLLTYNQGIRDVAAAFGAYVLDLEVAVTPEQYQTHKYDNIHPNLLGHEAMYEQMVEDFAKVYGADITDPKPVVEAIEITKAPDKVDYLQGEDFDASGMIVKATYSDDTIDADFSDYFILNGQNLALDTTSITISTTNSLIFARQPITVTADDSSDQDIIHEGIIYDNIISDGGNLPAGNYVLTQDIDLSQDIMLQYGVYNLFLNGFTLTGTGNSSVITAPNANVELNIYDLADNSGTIQGGSSANGGGIFANGATINIYAGTIANNESSRFGGGVYTANRGVLNLYGGIIENNNASSDGGGIGSTSTAGHNLFGGIIRNNTAGSSGGGVASAHSVNINGTSIVNNISLGNGGGVYVYNGDINIQNSIITGNSASTAGGAVYLDLDQRTLFVGSNTTIDNNILSSNNTANNIYLENGEQIILMDNATNLKIGLSTQSQPVQDEPIIVVSSQAGALSEEALDYFTADNSDYALQVTPSGAIALAVKEIEPIVYTITFSSPFADNFTVITNESGTLTQPLTNPSQAGYDFLGWFDGENQITATTVFSQDTLVVAKFVELPTFNITFVSQGENYAQISTDYNGILSSMPTNPSQAGYDFLGWFDGENQITATTVFSQDTVVVAKWQEISVTNPDEDGWYTLAGIEGGRIKFDASKGEITDAEKTITIANIPAEINGITVKHIDSHAFYDNDNLISVIVPGTVEKISMASFSKSSSLQSVVLSEGVKHIGISAFYNSPALTEISLPSSLLSIDNTAFGLCTALEQFIIPDNVTTIGNMAFYGSKNLSSLTIPASVTSIGKKIVWQCNFNEINYGGDAMQWEQIAIDDDNSQLLSATINFGDGSNGINLSQNDTGWLAVDGIVGGEIFFNMATGTIEKTRGNITIANIPAEINGITVKHIDGHAFYDNDNLISVTVPGTVEKISMASFSKSSSLQSVVLSEGVKHIGISAFYNSPALTEISLPSSLLSIDNTAFGLCTALEQFIIPDNVTTIGNMAFYGSKNLSSLTIPASVNSIGKKIVWQCNFNEINYGGDAMQWEQIAIDSDNSQLLSATINFGD